MIIFNSLHLKFVQTRADQIYSYARSLANEKGAARKMQERTNR